MVYLAGSLPKLKYPKYENVLVDECQDLNASQHLMIGKIRARKGGRLISVGDFFQTIYGFAGSDSDSFKKFASAPNTTSLPLSVTYRCPINVVLEAQKYSPEISAAPNAEYGYVGDGDIDMVEEGDAVLCRNNSPLFEAYLDLLYEGKKAYIVGKDIAEKFHTLIKPYRSSHVGALISGLKYQLEQIHDALSAKGVKKPLAHPKYQAFLDISRSLSLLAERSSSVKELEKSIDKIFSPQKDAIILSSIHKSKGLEYDRVFLLRPDLLPNKFAKSAEEIQQENNLMFVAITRSKSQFFYIHKEEEN
jgi:superfamily I DNA/RNA helicase